MNNYLILFRGMFFSAIHKSNTYRSNNEEAAAFARQLEKNGKKTFVSYPKNLF